MVRKVNSFVLRLFCVAVILFLGFPRNEAVASVKWLEQVHDFGIIKESEGEVSCNMRLVNVGDSAIVINRVSSTCGCTVTDYQKTAIEPNDTANIRLKFNPRGIVGQVTKKVYVHINGCDNPTTLEIKSVVIGSPETIKLRYPVVVGQMRLNTKMIAFGGVKKSEVPTMYFTGYNSGEDTLAVRFNNIPPHTIVDVVPKKVPPGEMCTGIITYYAKRNKDWGIVEDSCLMTIAPIEAGGMRAENAVSTQLSIMAVLTEDFSKMTEDDKENAPVIAVTDKKIDFEEFGDDVITKVFYIENHGKTPLKIHKIDCRCREVAVKLSKSELKQGKRAKVEVTIDAKKIENMLNCQLTVISNDPERSNMYVRLVGLKK